VGVRRSGVPPIRLAVFLAFLAATPTQAQTLSQAADKSGGSLVDRFRPAVAAAESNGARVAQNRDHGRDPDRRCVDATGQRTAESGEFVVGAFNLYRTSWNTGYGKLWFRPRVAHEGDTLTVRAVFLETAEDVQVYKLWSLARPIPDDGTRFYPSGVRLPHPGAWLLEVSTASNWGCFLFSF
jgi:hypothetical protein